MGRPPKTQTKPPTPNKRKERLKPKTTPVPVPQVSDPNPMSPFMQQNITPSLDWSLRDWIRESGAPTIKQIIAYAASVWPIDREWPEKTVYSWVSRGIPSRDDALRIIAALRIASTTRSRALFQGLRLFEHSEMFLYSRACLDAFRPPSLSELRQMVGAETLPTTGINDMRVLDQLSSPPPVPMIGRDLDVVRLLTECEAHPITVLHGEAGMGKTSLVWMTAQEARNVRYSMVREFDWVTLTPKTDVNDPSWRALVLRNIAARFRWADLVSLTDDQIEDAVAQKLRRDEVLVVFDQADGVEQFGQLLAWVKELLGDGEVSGRIILVSRQTPPADQRALQLGQMKNERMKEFWAHLDAGLARANIKVEASNRDLIIRASQGNPSIMKSLATVFRFRDAEAPSSGVSVINSLADKASEQKLQIIIDYVFKRLMPVASWLAVAVARTGRDITEANLYELWQTRTETGNAAEFDEARAQLVAANLLTPQAHRRETYVLTPPVEAYLLADR